MDSVTESCKIQVIDKDMGTAETILCKSPLRRDLHSKKDMERRRLALVFVFWVCSVSPTISAGTLGSFEPFLLGPEKYQMSFRSTGYLSFFLSFAVGGLLGDVFLHLLPEAWNMAKEGGLSENEACSQVGLCVLVGIFVFIVVEMIANSGGDQHNAHNNNVLQEKGKKQVTGYLNLIANGIDNFAHGLAVAGSFLVSYRTGILTTGAILLHEVPHEIGDFAILLKSGFSRKEAAHAQLYTAGIGLCGALFTLFLGTADILAGFQVYMLGFTAGGFLNIALVSILPDLLKEDSPARSVGQLLALLLGTITMAAVTQCQ
ncbi:unnamed protein product, partial [Meganyctiphanes norvegica]